MTEKSKARVGGEVGIGGTQVSLGETATVRGLLNPRITCFCASVSGLWGEGDGQRGVAPDLPEHRAPGHVQKAVIRNT